MPSFAESKNGQVSALSFWQCLSNHNLPLLLLVTPWTSNFRDPLQDRKIAKKDEMISGPIFASLGKSNPVKLTVSFRSTPDALKVSPQDAVFFNLTIGTNLFVGNLFTILLFRIIYKSGPWKPINIMIFMDQSVKIVAMTWNILVLAPSMSLMWSNGPALASYTGTAFCQVSFLRV